ncbi:MAG: DegV family protein [Candidatus Izemoplasmatales bacterium]|jgi:DegV family protein with EDD domain|nr:DegV family protein [Candidatus Izemoplasmatales bacterium]
MKKLGVLICTNSAIDYIPHKYDIRIIRSTILMGGKEYIDFEELTAEQFYQMLEADPELFPRTAMASTGTMLEAYEKYRDEGCDEVLFITISSKMSGIYENAMIAAKMVEGVHVTVFDSKTVGYLECKMAFTACEMAEKGASLADIMQELEFIRDNNKIYFAVDNLKYLVKNGRLSNAAGFFAEVLRIKPLLEIDKAGAVVSIEKIRTFRKALERVVEKFLEETEGKEYEPFIIHANNPDGVKFVRDTVLAARPQLGEIKEYFLTPAVGAHCGPKAMTVGYVLKK